MVQNDLICNIAQDPTVIETLIWESFPDSWVERNYIKYYLKQNQI